MLKDKKYVEDNKVEIIVKIKKNIMTTKFRFENILWSERPISKTMQWIKNVLSTLGIPLKYLVLVTFSWVRCRFIYLVKGTKIKFLFPMT